MKIVRAAVLFLFVVVGLACGGTSRLGSGTTGGPPPPPLPTFSASEVFVGLPWPISALADDGRTMVAQHRYIRDGILTEVETPPELSGSLTFEYLTPDGQVAYATRKKGIQTLGVIAYSPSFERAYFEVDGFDYGDVRKVEPDGTIWIELSKRYVYDPNGIRWKYPGPVEYVGYSGLPPRIEFDGTPDQPPGYGSASIRGASPDRQWAFGHARPAGQVNSVYFVFAADGTYTKLPDGFYATSVADGGNMIFGYGDSVEGMHNSPKRIWLRDRGIVSLEDAMAEAGFAGLAEPDAFLEIAAVSPSRRLYAVRKGSGSSGRQWLLTINPRE